MPFTVQALPDVGLIELSFTGEVDPEQLLESRQKVRGILAEGGEWNALVDMREIDWRASTLAIHQFAATIQKPAEMRVALVCRAEDEDAHFLRYRGAQPGEVPGRVHRLHRGTGRSAVIDNGRQPDPPVLVSLPPAHRRTPPTTPSPGRHATSTKRKAWVHSPSLKEWWAVRDSNPRPFGCKSKRRLV